MKDDQNLVTSIRVEIDAPASFVWGVLLDLPRYGEWNSFNPRIESTLRLGDPVQMDAIAPGSERVMQVTEYLVAFEPERRLAWEMRPTAESQNAGRRDQHLEPLGPERCAYHHTDRFVGPNADAIREEFGAWVKAGFDAMTLDLKRRAEALWAARERRAS
jgi:hypothetical protein